MTVTTDFGQSHWFTIMYHPCCFQLYIAGVNRSKVNRLQNRIILYIGKFIFGYYLIDSITIRSDRDFIRADYSLYYIHSGREDSGMR